MANDMTLQTFSAPGLPAQDDPYTITVHQTIRCGDDKVEANPSTLSFSVSAPRFTIPDEDVHSFYPCEGQTEEARILPHIVFSTDHLPWERALAPYDTSTDPIPLPWFALVVFTADELMTTDVSGPGKQAILNSARGMTTKISALVAADVAKGPLRCPNVSPNDATIDQAVTCIRISKQTFQNVFEKRDKSGLDNSGEFNRFRFSSLAHIRKVNVEGTSHSATTDSSEHPFSVVVSHRTPPPNISQPETVFVHLVSLDGISENLQPRPLDGTVTDIAMVSLYSWTYSCVPSGPVSYTAIMTDLKKLQQPLRRLDSLINPIKPPQDKPDPAADWLWSRLNDGFTFVRFRPFSGEQTVGLYRGPLVPNRLDIVKDARRPAPSDTGRDLQILDNKARMMDLTYSIAWELGRTLATADGIFASSIIRLRAEIYSVAINAARAAKKKSTLDTIARGKTAVPSGLDAIKAASQNTGETAGTQFSGQKRWANVTAEDVSISEEAPAGKAVLTQQLQSAVRTWLASVAAIQATSDSTSSPPPTTGVPASWLAVLRWIQAKLGIQGIPYIYLFPDPAVLPTEALRTFYIDDAWMDAFVDGALSLGNHMTLDNDPVKGEIRKSLNSYLKAMLQAKPEFRRWLPRWGLVLRSQMVRAFPNLRMETIETDPKPGGDQVKPPAFAQIANDTLFYLHQATPEDPQNTKSLLISQPFHHQRFCLGTRLDGENLDIEFKFFPFSKTKEEVDKQTTKVEPRATTWTRGDNKATLKCTAKPADGLTHFDDVALKPIYDWTTRCILLPNLWENCKLTVKAVLGEDVTTSTSTYVGAQLNDVLLSLNLMFGDGKPPLPNTPSSKERAFYDPLPDAPAPTPSTGTKPVAVNKTDVPAPVVTGEPAAAGDFIFPGPGFRLSVLEAAFHVVPKNEVRRNDAASEQIANSQLAKMCFPLLEVPANAFPAASPILLDVVFSLKTIEQTRADVFLRSVSVRFPVGIVNKNLLLPLSKRPEIRMIGKGGHWMAASSLVKEAPPTIFPTDVWEPTTAQETGGKHTYLLLKIESTSAASQNSKPLRLIDYPDPSFLLIGMALNTLESDKVNLLIEETYCLQNEEGEFVNETSFRSVLTVKKQKCDWLS